MKKELSFAFRRTIPVLFGYLFLGIAFGLMLQNAGYNFLWATLISTVVFAGSGQFALVGLLSGGATILTAAIMTISINCRHIFYGISFIEKFKSMGARGTYMIFSLTDETYSLLCSTAVPDDTDENKTLWLIAVLDHIYWILGSIIGALIGQFVPFNTNGIDFAMTALFVVIFVEQWLESKNRLPAIIGSVSGILCLVVFKADKFILPALILSVAVMTVFRQVSSKKGEVQV